MKLIEMLSEAILLQNVNKKFGTSPTPALHNISARIKRGKVTGIVGPDGAGKTTLLRLIAAIMVPTSGKISIDGIDASTHPELIHMKIGYMPQSFGLYKELSVLENLTLYADLRGLPHVERPSAFEQLLKFTALKQFTKRLAGNLSGGMKQKLGLACALLRQPEILLMDEPSAGVDPISRRDLWKIVLHLVEKGTTVLWSTSYLDEAENCDEVLALNQGELLFFGRPQDLIKRAQGRVFESRKKLEDRRGALLNILRNNAVVDGIIKGDSIRITLKDQSTFNKANLPEFNWEPRDPCFEDGFIDLLGGIKDRVSRISENMSNVQYEKNISIKAEHLTKKFGDFTAAQDISFEIKRGEIFGLLGPNGAGKSTTFKMLCGLLKPTSGNSSVMGYNLQHAPREALQKIGYMAQKFSLFGNLTVQHNLNFFAGAYNVSGANTLSTISNMIEIFNFDTYLSESAENLPLGYKQRLALACALMHQPPVLFLDEPTSGVDPLTRREFWMHINGMVQKGITVMVTTHFMDEAEYCDRICLIHDGDIVALGTPDELKKKAQTMTHIPTLEETFIRLIETHQANERVLNANSKKI